MKVVIASNDVTADDVLAIALLAVAANKTPRRGSSRGRETPQVVVSNDPKAIQEALEDKNFDGDVLSSVIKYLEGYFPEGWQVPLTGGWQVPPLELSEDFSADLARAIELIKETIS